MKITLDVPIEVKIAENGKTKETLKVTFRRATKEEEKQFEKIQKDALNLYKKINKLQRERNFFEKKMEFAEKEENYKKAEKYLDEINKIDEELEKLQEEFEEKGGLNWAEEIAKKTFDFLVGGEDKEKLREYAERLSYSKVIDLLSKERDKIEGKQSLE